MWAPEIEKSGNVGSRNREIRKCELPESRNPGNPIRKTWKSGKPGQLGALSGPDLAQPAPKWGTFWFKLPEGRSGPARPEDSPRGPETVKYALPLGGVYIRIGGSFWACNIWGNI